MQQIFAKATDREIHEHLIALSANGYNRLRVIRVFGSGGTSKCLFAFVCDPQAPRKARP